MIWCGPGLGDLEELTDVLEQLTLKVTSLVHV